MKTLEDAAKETATCLARNEERCAECVGVGRVEVPDPWEHGPPEEFDCASCKGTGRRPVAKPYFGACAVVPVYVAKLVPLLVAEVLASRAEAGNVLEPGPEGSPRERAEEAVRRFLKEATNAGA